MADKQEKPQNAFDFDYSKDGGDRPPQEFYDRIKEKFSEERDLRLGFRPPGTDSYTSDLSGELAKYAEDPHSHEVEDREPLHDDICRLAPRIIAPELAQAAEGRPCEKSSQPDRRE